MKRYLIILIILLEVVVVSAQSVDTSVAGIEKQQFESSLRLSKSLYPGDLTIDVKYYKLDLTVTSSPDYLKGSVQVDAVPDVNMLDTFFLDLSDNLGVDSVVSDNMNLSFTHQDNKLKITLPRAYQLNEKFSVIVYYQGVPNANGSGSFEFGSHNDQPAIWTLSEPYGARDWWPCKDNPDDKADSSQVNINCSNNLIPVSNGVLQKITEYRNGTHTYFWFNKYPIANYLISMAITNYTVYKTYFHYSPSDSMLVVHYIYPENLQFVLKIH